MMEKNSEGKLLLTRYNNKILLLQLKKNRLVRAQAFSEKDSILGNIYLGKVTNVVNNIDAAFVEITPGQICFLPLKECRHALLVNRPFDRRILAGDEVAVQVVKEAAKTKQPSVTANLSFTGTYCVVTTGKRSVGFSNKLKAQEKEAVKEFLRLKTDLFPDEEMSSTNCSGQNKSTGIVNLPQNFGYIFRTNCRELHENYEPLAEELKMLTMQAESFLATAVHRTCYSLLREAEPPYLSALSSVYQNEYEELVTDDEKLYEKLLSWDQIPASKIRFYKDEQLSMQKLYSVETKLSEALGKKVWLKSGGYLMIEPTEALTVIDVNTGKSIGKQSSKEHYLQTNLEAAEEIALQLRLRNLSGIIIVDFINMESKAQEEELMERLKNILKKDAVKTNVIDITPLGLVEITRQKISKPLFEQLNGGMYAKEVSL